MKEYHEYSPFKGVAWTLAFLAQLLYLSNRRAILLTRASVSASASHFWLFFCTTSLISYTLSGIALKLHILVSDHHPHFQARGYNSVLNFDKIMPLFRYRISVNFFVPPYLFPIPLEVLLWNFTYLLVTIIPTSKQGDITLFWILTRLCPFFDRISVKFFVPPYLFPIPFELLLWNVTYLLVTIIPTSKQGDITFEFWQNYAPFSTKNFG